MFFHRLEQGTLRLRGRAIHFIDQYHLRKERPAMKHEALFIPIENGIAENVGWKQVTGELNALKAERE